MKKLIYYALVLSGAFLSSCKGGNQYCECLDENLQHLKAYRLKDYQGEIEKPSVSCQELQKKSAEELIKIKGDGECPHYQELLKEQKMMMEHSLKFDFNEVQKNLNEIHEKLKPLEEKN